MHPISETVSQRGKNHIVCQKYKCNFHRMLSVETGWRCPPKPVNFFLFTVDMGDGRKLSSSNSCQNRAKIKKFLYLLIINL